MSLPHDIRFTARCTPFTDSRRAEHRISVSTDMIVRVYDHVAGHYTTCHSLSESEQARLVKAAKRIARQMGNGLHSRADGTWIR